MVVLGINAIFHDPAAALMVAAQWSASSADGVAAVPATRAPGTVEPSLVATRPA